MAVTIMMHQYTDVSLHPQKKGTLEAYADSKGPYKTMHHVVWSGLVHLLTKKHKILQTVLAESKGPDSIVPDQLHFFFYKKKYIVKLLISL